MLDLLLKTTTTRASYYYTTPNTTSEFEFANWFAGASAVLIVFAVIALLITLAVVILIVVSNCKIFAKAGEKWWKALIPLYNSWIQTKITGLAWYWYPIFVGVTALLAIYDSNFIIYMSLLLVSYNYCFNMAKKFGKSTGFAVLMAFLPVIGLPILAFGSAKYDKDAKVDANGIFSVN